MPIFKKWSEEGAQWGIWQVNESAEELRDSLTEISCEDIELQRFKSSSRQLEYLAVRVLLKEMLGHECRIAHYPSGKPYLPDSSFHITVSHTKGYVAIGLHVDREVGIDIERVAERVKKVTARFVRPDELTGWDTHSTDTQLYELLLVWSAKETLFKVLNQQEVDFLQHLRIAPFQFQPGGGKMAGYEYRTPEGMVYGLNYLTHPDFVCTYVVV